MSPLSSKLLKTWSVLSRWLLGLVLLAWLLLGLAWGALHGVIVPRIAEFRPLLEEQATQRLGLTVRVGEVAAQSSGLVPSFELRQVRLLDAQGREALRLPRVLVALSPRSLWRLGFEQVYIDQPELEVRRLADGRIRVAGVDVDGPDLSSPAALDWFFSQREFVVHQGRVRWVDEQRQVAPVMLQQLDLVLRNRGRHHDMRLDATPPLSWGARFSLQGRFLQPLLAPHPGRWQEWDGQLHAAFAQLDLSELRPYLDPGGDRVQGQGALRAWLALERGQLRQIDVDLALSALTLGLDPELPALALRQVQGRLGARRLPAGFEITSQDLRFETGDGVPWPGGKLQLSVREAQGSQPAQGELEADRLDLEALAQLTQRLPLAPRLRAQLAAYAPRGQVQGLRASWQGPWSAPEKYQVRGQASQLALAAVGDTPGVQGLALDFALDEQSGQASLQLSNGSLALPGILPQPELRLDRLTAEARWQIQGPKIAVQVEQIKVANADLQGEARLAWTTKDTADPAARFPGVLDLEASLSRADGKQVHRYLPLVIDQAARDYVREAVLAGQSRRVRFQVKGEIDQLPDIDPTQGVFRISAEVEGARLAYVPPSLQDRDDLPWPVLSDLSGELVIDRMQLRVNKARAYWGDNRAIRLERADVRIADLMHTQVQVDADLKGPLPEVLQLVNRSPLRRLTGEALVNSVASGQADYKLKLNLPIADIDNTSVRGTVVFNGNELQVTPDSPKLSRVRGSLDFSEWGFSVANLQARMLGGEARLDGGLLLAPSAGAGRTHPTQLRANGVATAEGLRQAAELGLVARLAQRARGSASYRATLGWRQGLPELLVQSDLQGLEVDLPEPLRKPADSPQPLRLQIEALPGAGLQDRLTLSVADRLQLRYERDLSQAEARVLRGTLALGVQQPVPMPVQGVRAHVQVKQLDVDAWDEVLGQLMDSTPNLPALAAGDAMTSPYLPGVLALRAESLTFHERTFNQLVLGGERDGQTWRANLQASELNGYLEYRPPSDSVPGGGAGRIYARLARLVIAPSVASEVEALLDAPPASIPALDIEVDDFELRGKSLGRLEIEAINQLSRGSGRERGVREWRLNKFNLSAPEARLTAHGNWVAMAGAPAGAEAARRRTALNFRLDIADSGALLQRLGMPGLVRGGRGKLEGQVGWLGAPLNLDYPSMSGAFAIHVESGQFLQAEPGIAKLLGVLSLQSLPRRLTLDFRDVFSQGFAFDFLRGDVAIDKGMATTRNLQMTGVNAAVLMAGSADIARETQDLQVVVIPEINAGTASLLASMANPAVGLSTFLAQLVLRRPLIRSATQEFHIDGSWIEPKITRLSAQQPQPVETP